MSDPVSDKQRCHDECLDEYVADKALDEAIEEFSFSSIESECKPSRDNPGIGPNPRKELPTPVKLTYHCPLKQLQALARTEYGINGQVDPKKLLHTLQKEIASSQKSFEDAGHSLDSVCRGIEHLGYERIEGNGHGAYYRQVIKLPGEVTA